MSTRRSTIHPGATPPPAGTAVERLAHELLDGPPRDPIGIELATWLGGSRRFRAFAEANREKIRKKLRGASDPAARLDLRVELRVAHLLLGDRRVNLAFEAYGATAGGPDFTVALGGERPFNLEVTRLRGPATIAGISGTVLAKLRQLPPSIPNALLVAVDGDAVDVGAAARELTARADAKDDAFFSRHGFDGARGFRQRLARLGAVIAWREAASGEERASTWTNPAARIALPQRAARACVARLREG